MSNGEIFENKYTLTDETIYVDGRTLYRIKALKDFGDVKKGDKGGYVESYANLAQNGDCWVADNAQVYNNAVVYDTALVYLDARVYDNAEVYGDANVYYNAKISGNAKVYGGAKVYGDAEVCGDARVYGDARVNGEAHVCDEDVTDNRYYDEEYEY